MLFFKTLTCLVLCLASTAAWRDTQDLAGRAMGAAAATGLDE